jgi:cyanate lyase
VQTGVRLEKRLVEVLKALTELQDLSLGDLIEHLVRQAFAGKPPLNEPVLEQVYELMRIYGLDPCASRRSAAKGE